MWTRVESPVGALRVVARTTEAGTAITAIEFEPWPASGRPVGDRDDEHPVLVAAREQLTTYFARERTAFDLPLAPAGTDFQRRVWQRLREIPHGATASYGEIARALGLTNAASRAVGLANGANPIPIVVPCHRVIGSDGRLTGYAGGVARKQTLLELEQDALF